MLRRKQLIPVLIMATVITGTVLVSSDRVRSVPPPPSPAKTSQTKVVAYYFHVNVRCTTCRTIESYSREVIYQNFADQIAKGRLEFKLVNVQLPENQHFIKDYQLFTKSLVLVRFENGRQAEYKVLNATWELVGNKEAMQGYVQREVRECLKRLS